MSKIIVRVQFTTWSYILRFCRGSLGFLLVSRDIYPAVASATVSGALCIFCTGIYHFNFYQNLGNHQITIIVCEILLKAILCWDRYLPQQFVPEVQVVMGLSPSSSADQYSVQEIGRRGVHHNLPEVDPR